MKHHIAVIASALLFATGAMAHDIRATPSDAALDALVRSAIEQTPELKSARATLDAARHRIEPARTPADPSLTTTYQNDGRGFSLGNAEGSFIGLMLSQALPWPGKLSLNGKVAESEAREIESGVLPRAALTIEARVRNAWYDLVLARALDRVIDDRRETAAQIEQTTRDRYAAGLAVQQDVLRAQVELARIDELKAAQRASIANQLSELNHLLGQPQGTPIETSSELPEIATLVEDHDFVASALQRSPELAAAKQSIETGRLRVGVAKKNFYPDFVVSGGSMFRGNYAMGPMWQVGVGVSIPLWLGKRQENLLAEAEARVVAQTADADAVARDLEMRTHERLAQLEAANDVAVLYRDRIIALDELSLESALASYRSGKVPFVTVFEAVNTLYADRATYLERLATAAKWRVAIDEASLEASATGGMEMR